MERIVVFLILLLPSVSAYSQVVGQNLFSTKTNPKGGPYAIMTLDTLRDAQTIQDIYARFPAKWVEVYRKVEISIANQDREVKSVSKSETLTREQLDMFADFGEEGVVKISIDYIPKNALTDNPPRRENFWLTLVPSYEAKYPGGELRLEDLLKDMVMEKLHPDVWMSTGLISFSFRVDPLGNIVQPQMLCSSLDSIVDQQIMDALQELEQWTPAIDHRGKAISQEFEFRIGTDLMRCDYKY